MFKTPNNTMTRSKEIYKAPALTTMRLESLNVFASSSDGLRATITKVDYENVSDWD